MRRMPVLPHDAVIRDALALSGLIFLASATMSGALALERMRAAAAICGSPGLAHCVWCAATVALLLAGLGSLGAAAPRLRALRARA